MEQLPIIPVDASLPVTPPTPAPTEAAPQSAPTEAPPAIFEGLPKEVQSLPVIQWLSVGTPPAVRFGPQEYFPELRPLIKNAPALVESGLGLFASQSGDTVLFNPLFIDLAELQAADQAGKLQEVIPDYAALAGTLPQTPSPEEAVALQGEQEQAGRELKDMYAPPSAAPQAVSRPTTAGPTEQRLKGLVPEGPADGPAPGRGRLINALLTPAK